MITGIIISVLAVGCYMAAVGYIFSGLLIIQEKNKQILADLEDIQRHSHRVHEALALWNYGAHEEAIELLRDEGFECKQTLDAE